MRVYRSVTLIVALSAAAAASAAARPLPAQQPGAARLASDTRDASVVRDSAIRQLQGFLQEYPASPLRPNALLQLGELLVQRADELFAERQRATTPVPSTTPGDTTTAATPGSIAASTTAARPDYSEAIAVLEELVRRYPDFDRLHEAAYTLGTLYMGEAEYANAARTFRMVTADSSAMADTAAAPLRAESFFRLGDAVFEQAAQASGARRRELFAEAATAYEQATQLAEQGGDIWFLAQYKLGWAYYNQATTTNQQEYRQAVETFDRLIAAYDQLTEEQQARLGLRQEAIEYMAISFTQIGGAEAASRYFESRGGAPYRVQVLRRVATGLRDQGNFPQAVLAYRMILDELPTDSSALDIQREIVDIYQNRMLQPDSAQAARLALVERFAPGSAWAQANPGLADSARAARETALRESGQYLLASAQRGRNQQQFTEAARLYERYLTEFPQSDSARAVALYLGEALFGQGDYARAGAAYTRSAYGFTVRDSLTQLAAQNAIVAYDSALARNRTDRAVQDSMFQAVYRFVEAFPETETAKTALQQAGRRASQAERWDALEQTFRIYVQRFPNDAYTPTAQRLIADALYQQGQYAEAQNQWTVAEQAARAAGQTSAADSIRTVRTAAAVTFADTLIKQGEYRRAAEEVYVSIADRNPDSPLAPGALRDAIETYRLQDSAATARGDEAASREAKRRAVQLAERLISTYPNYELRRNYQILRANYLADLGQRDEAVTALQELVQQNRNFEGRSGAMLRIALLLDSLGRGAEAAEAYGAFSQAYPRDPQAANAQWNAAIIYRDAGDTTRAAQEFGRFASRFPSDERAGEARANRLALIRSGDPAALERELQRDCQRPTEEIRDLCAERAARVYFEAGQRLWPQYDALELRITGTLTTAAVNRASAQKLQLRNRMLGQFQQAIETGHPLYLSGATYYAGLAQWEYGNFLRDVQLPASMPAEQQEAARQAAAQQAEEFYAEARNIWQALLERAQQENINNEWIERTRAALRGDVQVPPAGGDDAGTTDGGE